MTTQNPFDGSVYLSPDFSAGFGTVISAPATVLSNMVANGIYFQEIGGDVDVVLINCEGYLISLYKSLSNQRLMQQFVGRSTNIASQNKIRWVHRNLALSMTFEQVMKSIGENITVNDTWATAADLQAINQQLAPKFIQIFAAP